jgi:hypothetical protein
MYLPFEVIVAMARTTPEIRTVSNRKRGSQISGWD